MNDSHDLKVGAKWRVKGFVLKVVRRVNALRLVVDCSAGPGGSLTVFANFKDDVFKANKIRKGVLVNICGKVTSFGLSAVCLSGCEIKD